MKDLTPSSSANSSRGKGTEKSKMKGKDGKEKEEDVVIDVKKLILPQINRPGVQMNEDGSIDKKTRLAKPLTQELYKKEDLLLLNQYLEHLRSDERDEATPRELTDNYRTLPPQRVSKLRAERIEANKPRKGFEVKKFGAGLNIHEIEESFEKVKWFEQLYAFVPTEYPHSTPIEKKKRLRDFLIPPPEHDPFRVKYNSFRHILEKDKFRRHGHEPVRNGQYPGIGQKLDVIDYYESDKIFAKTEEGKSLKELLKGRLAKNTQEDMTDYQKPESYVNTIEPDSFTRYQQEQKYFKPLYRRIYMEDIKNYNPTKKVPQKIEKEKKRKKKKRKNCDSNTEEKNNIDPTNRENDEGKISQEGVENLLNQAQNNRKEKKKQKGGFTRKEKEEEGKAPSSLSALSSSSYKRFNASISFISDSSLVDDRYDKQISGKGNNSKKKNITDNTTSQLPLLEVGRKIMNVASHMKNKVVKTYQSIDNYRNSRPQIDLEGGDKLPVPLKYDYWIRETNKAITMGFDMSDTLLDDVEKIRRQSRFYKLLYGNDVEIKDEFMLLHAVDVGSPLGIKKSQKYGINIDTPFGHHPPFLICFQRFLQSNELDYMNKITLPQLQDETNQERKQKKKRQRRNVLENLSPLSLTKDKAGESQHKIDELNGDDCENSYKRACALLLHYGANINCHEKERKRTALHLACEQGKINHVKWLIVHGCNLDIKDGQERTPLMTAIEFDHFEITKLLIQVGAFLAPVDLEGNLPLHYAARCGSEEIILLLIRANSPGKLIQNNLGKYPSDMIPQAKFYLKDLLSFKVPTKVSAADMLNHAEVHDKEITQELLETKKLQELEEEEDKQLDKKIKFKDNYKTQAWDTGESTRERMKNQQRTANTFNPELLQELKIEVQG